MKIDILCPSGSPTGISPIDIYDRGVGGAELALMSFAQVMAKRGHSMRVFNSPPAPGLFDGVEYLPVGAFQPGEGRDVAILFRVPYKQMGVTRGRKIFWSCDQHTEGNFQLEVFPYVDKIVVISKFHYDYFVRTYNAPEHRMYVTDLGVRDWDYAGYGQVEKVPGQCIFCSVPGRGLNELFTIWPRIRQAVPNATLVVTSDYRLWGNAEPLNKEFVRRAYSLEGVKFLGKVPRAQLVELQLQSEVQTYPCTYDELFCISVAECQFAGAVPVTSQIGAVKTTNAAGIQVGYHPTESGFEKPFARAVINLLQDYELRQTMSESAHYHAATQFNWEAIAMMWEEQVLKA